MALEFKYAGQFPDAIKIKKRLDLYALDLSSSLTWHIASGSVTPRLSMRVRSEHALTRRTMPRGTEACED